MNNTIRPFTKEETFKSEVSKLINRLSLENDSNTPDFILANYLWDCLKIFGLSVDQRSYWYGRRDTIDYLTKDYALKNVEEK